MNRLRGIFGVHAGEDVNNGIKATEIKIFKFPVSEITTIQTSSGERKRAKAYLSLKVMKITGAQPPTAPDLISGNSPTDGNTILINLTYDSNSKIVEECESTTMAASSLTVPTGSDSVTGGSDCSAQTSGSIIENSTGVFICFNNTWKQLEFQKTMPELCKSLGATVDYPPGLNGKPICVFGGDTCPTNPADGSNDWV
ncbi:MAG: hypothetical protein ACO3A2_07250 [Bdellovibrionia bacterium]